MRVIKMQDAEHARLNEAQYGDWLRGTNLLVVSKSKGLEKKDGSSGYGNNQKTRVESGGLIRVGKPGEDIEGD